MKCNRCEKNAATVRLTRIVKGKVVELNLCQDCAAEVSPYQKKFATAQGINALIAHLLQAEKGKKPEAEGRQTETVDITCRHCGVSFQAYKRSLMLGCARCYESFGEYLLSDIRKIHGSLQHVGHVPTRQREQVDRARALESLRKELDKASKEDDFERAAELRDRLKALQSEMSEDS